MTVQYYMVFAKLNTEVMTATQCSPYASKQCPNTWEMTYPMPALWRQQAQPFGWFGTGRNGT